MYREKLERLRTIIQANLQLIRKKVDKPAEKNECSFIEGFNLVQEAVDPEQYRKVMKKIFEKLDQSQHHRMMTNDKT